MKFVCERHPSLIISDLGVKFVNGETTVDAETAAKLRALPPELGIRPAVDTQPAAGTSSASAVDEDDPAPTARRSRGPK